MHVVNLQMTQNASRKLISISRCDLSIKLNVCLLSICVFPFQRFFSCCLLICLLITIFYADKNFNPFKIPRGIRWETICSFHLCKCLFTKIIAIRFCIKCIMHIYIFKQLYTSVEFLYFVFCFLLLVLLFCKCFWFVGFLFLFWILFFVRLIFHMIKLTATVEPFLPTPPARITLKMRVNDQTPPITVATDIVFHSSKPPKI